MISVRLLSDPLVISQILRNKVPCSLSSSRRTFLPSRLTSKSLQHKVFLSPFNLTYLHLPPFPNGNTPLFGSNGVGVTFPSLSTLPLLVIPSRTANGPAELSNHSPCKRQLTLCSLINSSASLCNLSVNNFSGSPHSSC